MSKLRMTLTRLRLSLVEAILVYPLLLILAVYVIEISPYLLLGAVALSVLGGRICGARLRREAAQFTSASVPLLICLILAVLPIPLSIGQLVCVFILLVIAGGWGVHLELRVLPNSRTQTLAALFWLVAGVVLYQISFASEPLEAYRFSIYLFAVLSLAFMLLRWNTGRIRESQGLSGSEEMPTNPLLYANRGLTTLLMVLILGVGLILPLSNPLAGLFSQGSEDSIEFRTEPKKNSDISSRCVILYEQLKQKADREGKEVSYDDLPPECQFIVPDSGNPADEGHGWIVGVMALCVVLAILAVLYYILRVLYILFADWLPEWLKKLLANLRITAGLVRPDDEQAYLDTTEKVKQSRKKKRFFVSFAEPEAGPRRDYFRLVRSAVRKGYSFRPWLTPSETGREIADESDFREMDRTQVEEVIERYNRVRYDETQGRKQ
ncbi:hypothetical protein B9G55_15900 [Saccharibacillus sp. O16]|nr:hypothetical protein B9G55_15900 [Saccharibacillus sp. O16]